MVTAWLITLPSAAIVGGSMWWIGHLIRGASGAGGEAEEPAAGMTGPAPHVVGRIIGYLCFAIVLAVAALGITYIVATGFGKALSFEHIYPTIVSTKH